MWTFIVLAGCTGSTGADDTSGEGSPGGDDGDAPAMPTAGEGEGAVVIRDGGQDKAFTCTTDATYGSWWEIPADYPIDGFHLSIGCGEVGQGVLLVAYVDARVTGSHAVTSVPTSEDDVFVDTLEVQLFPDGQNGFRLNEGMPFSGTVTLDEVGGDGAAGVGTLVATWTNVYVLEGGEAANEAEERPGALAMAFDFPFSGP